MKLVRQRARLARAALALSALAGPLVAPASAQFTSPATPAFRGQPNSEYSGWDVFQFADGTPNPPDDPATTSDDATLSQDFPGAFVDGTGDIASFDFMGFFVVDSVPGDLQEVVLQTASLAPHRNPTSYVLIWLDAEGDTHGAAPVENVTLFESGSHRERLVRWDLSGIADTILGYTLSFVTSGPGGTFEGALLDTRFTQPIELVFCDQSDGSLASCPCANPGDADTGCDIAQGTGGVRLDVLAQSTAPNVATLQGIGFSSMGAPTAIVIRSDSLDPARPVVFGDGLRCVNSSPLVRLAATTAVGGVSQHVFGHNAMAGSGPFYYQIWFRNTPSTFCDPFAAYNLSSGRTLIWP